jgi:hypothetical protein
MKGDGNCDSVCNNQDCDYDSGDCGCNRGCDYGREDCRSACIVLDCEYSSRIGQCDTAYLRAAGLYYQILTNDTTAQFSMSACQATSTSCTEAILESNYEGTACDTTSCDSIDCAYGLGCYTALLTTHPANCLQSTLYDECLKCADCYFNYEASCVLDCPTDYYKERVDGDNLCVTSQYTTERLVVDPSSSDSSVYKTLYAAMYAVSAQKSIIYLVDGSHTLEIDSSITPSSEKQFDPLYQTTTKKSFRLTTAYCDEIDVPNCVTDNSNATVVLRDPLMKITSYFTTFEITNLIFDGASALDANCTAFYCRYCPWYKLTQKSWTETEILDDTTIPTTSA